jgi:hypothetical protein
MKYFDLLTSYPDHTIAAAWESQISDPSQTPWLTELLRRRGDELFGRFAERYAEVRALPRAARRALQRQLARSGEFGTLAPIYLQHGGRRLQHRMAWSLAGAALLLALAQEPVSAATITVTTSNPNIAPDGQCSLVEAIVNANNDAATHADCPAGSGADTIVLPANANVMLNAVYGMTYAQFGSPIGLPSIMSRITIEGNGATIARQANAPDFGLIFIRGNFSSEGVPPRPGDLTLQNVTISGGTRGGVANAGRLNIQSSIISGNTGRGITNSGALTVENSVISNNTAVFWGGGLYDTGTTTIIRSSISGNVAGSSGGGVYNFYGNVTIENSTVSNNTATLGGGASNSAGGLRIINSTISGNRANRAGGVSNSEYCYFYCTPGTLTLQNSLIAGNEASIAPEIENAIATHPRSLQLYSIVNANNFNLFGSNGNAGVTGFAPGPRDIVPSASLGNILGPLTNNGGPTQTHALIPGSPAVDAGDPAGCRNSQGAVLATDQRGFTRHVDGNHDAVARCDIGAVEFGAGSATLIDFDGDGSSDIGVYREGIWFIRRSFDAGMTALGWGGLVQDRPVPADYDGDGKVDIAVYRDGIWFILRSSDGGQTTVSWGGVSVDVPIPADYDGDGKADITVYRDGIWFILRSSDGGQTTVGWGGVLADVPIPADYDGDEKADIAVYRNGTWFIIRSSDGAQVSVTWGGAAQDIPLPADYDGDGKADLAVYRDGIWFIVRSSDNGQIAVGWGGLPQDIPVPADFDGDGKVDVAVYRDGTWFILRSSDGGMTATGWGGAPQDIPLN